MSTNWIIQWHIGSVLDIVYKENESPDNFDLPSDVLVESKLYRGKPFLSNKPKVVPIVPTTVQCKETHTRGKVLVLWIMENLQMQSSALFVTLGHEGNQENVEFFNDKLNRN